MQTPQQRKKEIKNRNITDRQRRKQAKTPVNVEITIGKVKVTTPLSDVYSKIYKAAVNDFKQKVEQEEQLAPIEDMNPTGSVFVEYAPEERVNAPLSSNIVRLSDTAGKDPNETVMIYRGTVAEQKEIVPGDFVTTNKQLAQDYAGTGKIISKLVKYSDILDDIDDPLGEEYIYRPFSASKEKEIKKETDAPKVIIEQEEYVLEDTKLLDIAKKYNLPLTQEQAFLVQEGDTFLPQFEKVQIDTEQQMALMEQGFAPLSSSNIAAVRIDGADLLILFHSGDIYRYQYKAEMYYSFNEALSPGRLLHRTIRFAKVYSKE